MIKHEWSCGHIAGSMCAECYQELIKRANALAENNLELHAEVEGLRQTIASMREHTRADQSLIADLLQERAQRQSNTTLRT